MLLTRPNTTLKVFAGTAQADELTLFGEATQSTDVALILNNTNASDGWASGVDGNGFPTLEWFNATSYTFSYVTSLLLQDGIPKWVSLQEYYIYSRCTGSDGNVYKSLTGVALTPNLGNDPVGDAINWVIDGSIDINGQTNKPTPIDTDNYLIQEVGELFKKVSWLNIKATLKIYFDTLYGQQLQVKQTAKTNQFSMSGTSFVPITGVNMAIAPSKNTNKILIQVSINGNIDTAGQRADFRLKRDGVVIGEGVAGANTAKASGSLDSYNNGTISAKSVTFSFLDDPSTTSSTTYSVEARTTGGILYINGSGTNLDTTSNVSTITTLTVSEVKN